MCQVIRTGLAVWFSLLLSTSALGPTELTASSRAQHQEAVEFAGNATSACSSLKSLSTRVISLNANHAEIVDKKPAFASLESGVKGVLQHEAPHVVALMFQELLHAEFPEEIVKMMQLLEYDKLVSSATAGYTKMGGNSVETTVTVFVKKNIKACFSEAEVCTHVHFNGKTSDEWGGFDPKKLLGIETKFAEIVEFKFTGGPSFLFAGVHMTTGGFQGDILKLISVLDDHPAQHKLFAGDFNTRILDADKSDVCDGESFSENKFLQSFSSSSSKKVWEIKDPVVVKALQKSGWSVVSPGTTMVGKSSVVLPTYKYSTKVPVGGPLTEKNLGEVFGGACKGAKKVNLGVLDKIAVKDVHTALASQTIPVQGSDHAMVTAHLDFPLSKAAVIEEVQLIV